MFLANLLTPRCPLFHIPFLIYDFSKLNKTPASIVRVTGLFSFDWVILKIGTALAESSSLAVGALNKIRGVVAPLDDTREA
jgi:hypothetical protein